MTDHTRRRLLGGIAAASLWSGMGFPIVRAQETLKVGVIHMGAISNTGWEYYQAEAWRALQAK
jgi:simple sugar transport system substrate-binding protein